ncbi:site-specific integrase [Sulfitobacter sp. 1A13421]|uniref:site-specific integrase n=1 Tax=Sulfitobacter sp. 1A13421 TaxID=3368595 RepID=UPI0037468209
MPDRPSVALKVTEKASTSVGYPPSIHEDTQRYIDASQAPATIRAYAADWRIFEDFCLRNDLCPLPASPETVAYFLTNEANRGLKIKTIERRISAIADYHGKMGQQAPTGTPGAKIIAAVMQGIRREIGEPVEKKHPATDEVIIRLIEKITGDALSDYRDRALLAFGMASAMRRGEISALSMEDLSFGPRGVTVTIEGSKTDKNRTGQVITVPHGRVIRPVSILQDWLEAAEITSGPVFRPVVKGGRRTRRMHLTGHAIARIVKNRALDAGLDPKLFSGHSFRSGFVTTAALKNAPLSKIMEQTRHKDVNTVRQYFAEFEKFNDHAGTSFL